MNRSFAVCAVMAVCCSGFARGAAARQAAAGAKLTSVSAVLVPVSSANASSSSATTFSTQPPAASGEHADALGGTEAPVSPLIGEELLSKIPHQVLNKHGQPGDVVNLLILGDRHDVRKAIGSAGWSRIATTKLGSLWHDIWGALDIRSYRGVPMSKLYLFGRQQDVSYANSKMPFCFWGRHHFRIWQAPFQVDGETLWIAAATHDIGVRWNNGHPHLIHKIDPNVDAERQYVSHTLTKTGRVEVVGYVSPDNAPTQAETTTGEEFFTDGRALVLRVLPKISARAAGATQLP